MTADMDEPLPAIQIEVPAMHREGTKPAGFIPLLSREYPTIDGTNVLPFTLAHLVQVLAALTQEQRRAVVKAARIGLADFPECEDEPAYEGPEPLL